MSNSKLNILVLLREVCDPRTPVRLMEKGAGIRDKEVRRIPNPADLGALEQALGFRDAGSAQVTVVAVGPKRLDDSLRLALSMGADRVIRIWDGGLKGGDAVAEARVLSRAIEILKPDLFFCGNRLLDRGSDPAPAVAAAARGIPYVTAALSLARFEGGLEILRKGDKGARLKVATSIPCAVFFEDGLRDPRYPSQDALMRSVEGKVESWGLPELGLPFWELGGTGALLQEAEYGLPRPNPLRVTTPDANLPAYERILALLSGGIKAREGKMHTGSVEDVADGLFRIIKAEGLLPETQG